MSFFYWYIKDRSNWQGVRLESKISGVLGNAGLRSRVHEIGEAKLARCTNKKMTRYVFFFYCFYEKKEILNSYKNMGILKWKKAHLILKDV